MQENTTVRAPARHPDRPRPGPRWLRAAVLTAVLATVPACGTPAVTDGLGQPTGTTAAGSGDPLLTLPPAGPSNPRIADPSTRLLLDPAEARFDEGRCHVLLEMEPGPRCGTVTVPERWSTGLGEIQLAVMVLPSSSDTPAPDAVAYLGGGPGAPTLANLPGFQSQLDVFRERGDVIVFDQRGSGLSSPALECPDIVSVARSIEDDPTLTDGEANRRVWSGLERCGQKLRGQGIDLGAFNTIDNAHDVEAVRRALGYPAWNLYGGSYGTRLGLEVVRQHPASVRSMVLDSVFPPEADLARDGPAAIVDSLEAVAAACGREPACREGGDLLDRLKVVAAGLDADPLEVTVQDYLSGLDDTVTVTGRVLAQTVEAMLTSIYALVDLPDLVTQLEQRLPAGLAQILARQRLGEQSLSLGAFWAFTCNEEVPFSRSGEVAAALPPDPFGRHERFVDSPANTGPQAFEACRAFDPHADGDPQLAQPVDSEAPALLLAGRYDPRTPAAWAFSAADHLPASQVAVDPDGAHGVSLYGCALDVVMAFLDDPYASADTSCLTSGGLRFVESYRTPSPDLAPVTYTSSDQSRTVDTDRPVGWTTSTRGESAWRSETMLDPVMLYQDAGPDALVTTMEHYVADTWGVTLSAPEADERDGRRWEHRTGASGSITVEWFQSDMADRTVVVLLAAAPVEADQLRRDVLDPALASIDVRK